jgi:hypothetical protein
VVVQPLPDALAASPTASSWHQLVTIPDRAQDAGRAMTTVRKVTVPQTCEAEILKLIRYQPPEVLLGCVASAEVALRQGKPLPTEFALNSSGQANDGVGVGGRPAPAVAGDPWGCLLACCASVLSISWPCS